MDKKKREPVEATYAGGNRAKDCTLILVEGVSAYHFAKSALKVIGERFYGIYALTGNFINPKKKPKQKVMNNVDVKWIMKLLGLKWDEQYNNVKSLRYGHLMILTDQDDDGQHIKGLIINFIHSFWESLLKIPKFIMDFPTPLLKATVTDGEVFPFYSMLEYNAWKENFGGDEKIFKLQYYKGLSCHSESEITEYFINFKKHRRYFSWETDFIAIKKAFCAVGKHRKDWIKKPEAGSYVSYLSKGVKFIRYKDFIEKELILYFKEHLQRSIPSMVDGLKPTQRKILYIACKKKKFQNLTSSSVLMADVKEDTQYKHGGKSLYKCIVGMNQNSIGTNNLNLLETGGQIGTVADPTDERYVDTKLAPITRSIFVKDDHLILDQMKKDGTIEPTWFAPIIPMALVNGCRSVGVGWNTYVPNYNPGDLCANARRFLNDKPVVDIDPWYSGFGGQIDKDEDGKSYTTSGVIEKTLDRFTFNITQLPLNQSAENYRKELDKLSRPRKLLRRNMSFIKNYKQLIVGDTVHFKVTLSKASFLTARKKSPKWLLKKLKLTSAIKVDNLHLFDPNGEIMKYEQPKKILEQFFPLRMELYTERKKMLLANLKLEWVKLEYLKRYVAAAKNNVYEFPTKDEFYIKLENSDLLCCFPMAKKFDTQSQTTVYSKQFKKCYRKILRPEYLFDIDTRERELLAKEKDLENVSPRQFWEEDLAMLEQQLKEAEEALMKKDIDTLENFLYEQEPNNKDAITEAEVERENEVAMADNNVSEKLHGLSLQKV